MRACRAALGARLSGRGLRPNAEFAGQQGCWWLGVQGKMLWVIQVKAQRAGRSLRGQGVTLFKSQTPLRGEYELPCIGAGAQSRREHKWWALCKLGHYSSSHPREELPQWGEFIYPFGTISVYSPGQTKSCETIGNMLASKFKQEPVQSKTYLNNVYKCNLNMPSLF